MAKLAIDLDEVCCQFVNGFLSYYNLRFGTEIKKSHIIHWNWWELDIGITKQNFDQAFNEFTSNRMWQELEIYPDVKHALCSLSEDGHEIHFFTDRPKYARRATLKFILKHGLPVDSIIFCRGKEKAAIAQAVGIDVAIDDKPQTIKSYLKNEVNAVMRLQPHNFKEEINCKKVKSMHEFYVYINELYNKKVV